MAASRMNDGRQFTATVYPATPPPSAAANPNAYYNSHWNNNNNHNNKCRQIFNIIIVTLMFLLIIVFIILKIVFTPKSPIFVLTNLSLSSLNTSSSSSISGNWTASFSISNPNSIIHLFYHDLFGSVSYRSEELAWNRLPDFNQAVKSADNLSFSFVGSGTYVDGWAVGEIEGDRANGIAKFNIKIRGTVSLKPQFENLEYLSVYCKAISVEFSGKNGIGLLAGGRSRKCAVRFSIFF